MAYNPRSLANLRPGAGRRPCLTPEKRIEIKIEKDARAMAREHTAEAIATLVDVNLNGKSEGARVSAASELLDRGWDKPVQGVAVSGGLDIAYAPPDEHDLPLPAAIRDRLIGAN